VALTVDPAEEFCIVGLHEAKDVEEDLEEADLIGY
jgi:hypothetical protein